MKIYGKPPLPPKGKNPLNTVRTGMHRRSASLADIKIPNAPNLPTPNFVNRKSSGLQKYVQASAKLIHEHIPKPRSATSARSTKLSSSACSGSFSGYDTPTKSSNSSPRTLSRKKGKKTVNQGGENRPSSPFLIPAFLSMKYVETEEALSLDRPDPTCGEWSPEDANLLHQSDQLFEEALALCNETSFELNERLCQSARSSDEGVEREGPDHGGAGDMLLTSGDGITSLPSLSLISSVASTPIPTARSQVESTLTQSPEKPMEGNGNSSSSEYDYKKVFGILRMIEEEEAKGSQLASCFSEIMREKYSASSPGSSRSIQEMTQGVSPGTKLTASTRPMSSDSFRPNISGEEKVNHPNSHPEIDESNQVLNAESRMSPKWPLSLNSSPRQEELDKISMVSLDDFLPGTSARPASPFGEGFQDGKLDLEADKNLRSISSRSSQISEPWETSNGKTKHLLTFLDEVEQSDREKLFNLKFDSRHNSTSPPPPRSAANRSRSQVPSKGEGRGLIVSRNKESMDNSKVGEPKTLDTLIRKGSVELAREVIMLERQVEDSTHNIHILEETLLSQRELNIRNMKNSERDLKKRLKLQQEEFELALSRHQAFVDQLISEKRALQEKCEKILKDSKDNEERYTQQIKSIQEKHLEEIKRLRKAQENVEKNKKQQWVGQKTQEIRDMTVKGLEPEVQRIIQRHQQEMSEMRAYYANEMQDIEERYARKQTHQLQELRESFNREKDEACRREREILQKRHESELQRQAEDFETQKRRLLKEIQEEKDRLGAEEIKIRESAQENVRKSQIKHEVELDNLRQEWETKVSNLEKRHEKEIQSLRDNFESQRENWIANFNKKNEQVLQDRETRLVETLNQEKEKEIREREKKVKDEYERIRKEEESVQESRIKRLQEKFQSEIEDLEKSERELKLKFSAVKAEVIAKEEEVFSLRTTLAVKEKENFELAEANVKMNEERVHLTSIIRREFASQIETLEEDCKGVKAAVVELKAKHKLDLETHQVELEKLRNEKDNEIEKIGMRVKQALARKEETLLELTKQLEKGQIRVNHLESLLEQQRQDFVSSMTSNTVSKKK